MASDSAHHQVLSNMLPHQVFREQSLQSKRNLKIYKNKTILKISLLFMICRPPRWWTAFNLEWIVCKRCEWGKLQLRDQGHLKASQVFHSSDKCRTSLSKSFTSVNNKFVTSKTNSTFWLAWPAVSHVSDHQAPELVAVSVATSTRIMMARASAIINQLCNGNDNAMRHGQGQRHCKCSQECNGRQSWNAGHQLNLGASCKRDVGDRRPTLGRWHTWSWDLLFYQALGTEQRDTIPGILWMHQKRTINICKNL